VLYDADEVSSKRKWRKFLYLPFSASPTCFYSWYRTAHEYLLASTSPLLFQLRTCAFPISCCGFSHAASLQMSSCGVSVSQVGHTVRQNTENDVQPCLATMHTRKQPFPKQKPSRNVLSNLHQYRSCKVTPFVLLLPFIGLFFSHPSQCYPSNCKRNNKEHSACSAAPIAQVARQLNLAVICCLS
jgi:hypothetical protein